MSNPISNPTIYFGHHSYLVENSDFVRFGLEEDRSSSFVEFNGSPLCTIGYDREGFDLLLDQIKTKSSLPITHLSFHHPNPSPHYTPSINLMDTEFSLEDITLKVHELIEKTESYHVVLLSFSKVYITHHGPQEFIAHASPLLIVPHEGKTLLFIFEEAAQEIANNIMTLHQHVDTYYAQGLLHSSANCNIFSLSIIKTLAKDPELIDFMVQRRPLGDRLVAIPLLPSYLPSKMMMFCESIRAKLHYVSHVDRSLATRCVCLEDITHSPCAKVILVRAKKFLVTTQETPLSTLLYLKNIKSILWINRLETTHSRLEPQLIAEQKKVLEQSRKLQALHEETPCKKTLLDAPIHHTIQPSHHELQEIGKRLLMHFYHTLSHRAFLCLSDKELTKEFHSFAEAFTLDSKHQLFSFFDFFNQFGYPPNELLNPDYYMVPLQGFFSLLGVSRALADMNIWGEGQSAGFIWVRNESGVIVNAQAVKIVDANCCPFIFERKAEERVTPNAMINTQQKLGLPARWLKDQKDIQMDTSCTHVVAWKSLSSEQKEEFLEGMTAARDRLLQYGLAKGLGLDPVTSQIVEDMQGPSMRWLADQMEIYFDQQGSNGLKNHP